MPTTQPNRSVGARLRPVWFSNQIHPRLPWRAVSLAGIASNAGAHKVTPTVFTTSRLRQYVINGEFGCRESSAAVLAFVAVPRIEIPSIQRHVMVGAPIAAMHTNDARHGHVFRCRTNPLIFTLLVHPLQFSNLQPRGQIKLFPPPVDDRNNFCDASEEEDEGLTNRYDTGRRVSAVEYEHRVIEKASQYRHAGSGPL